MKQYVTKDCVWLDGFVDDPAWVRPGLVYEPAVTSAYEPMSERPALFLEFARLGEKMEDMGSPENLQRIRAFAKKHGALGVYTEMTLVENENIPAYARSADGAIFAEMRDTWWNEARRMHALVEFLHAIRDKHKGRLGGIVKLDPPDKPPRLSYSFAHGYFHLDLNLVSNGYLQQAYANRDQLALGSACLAQEVSRLLDDRGLDSASTRRFGHPVHRPNAFHAGIVHGKSGFELQHIPRNLLAAMWLQFAYCFTEQKEFKACRNCGGPFEVGFEKDGKKRSALYCSDACRVAFHNKRKAADRRAARIGPAASQH